MQSDAEMHWFCLPLAAAPFGVSERGCSMMKTAVIILAAGLGKRMQAGCNKMFLTIQGKNCSGAYSTGFSKQRCR